MVGLPVIRREERKEAEAVGGVVGSSCISSRFYGFLWMEY